MKNELNNLLHISFAILIILLSIFNLQKNKITEVKVLGTSDEKGYWQDLVLKHPTYINGWYELNRLDKVREIDPNYLQP